MSLGRRLIDLARAELNSLLDKASSSREDEGPPDADEDLYRRYGLDELTDAELEAELERRRLAREASARAARARAEDSARRAEEGARRATEGARRASQNGSRPRPAATTGRDELRLAYAALEVAYGADFETVRTSYRSLMRKYHPDRQGPSPEKQKAANELAQRLTAAYKVVRRHLRK